MNKIIRESVIISTREHPSILVKIAQNHIDKTKERAKKVAYQLKLPKDYYETEIFDVFYPGDSSFYERPMNEKSIESLEEMLSRASAAGRAAKYTYIIDGDRDKDGNLMVATGGGFLMEIK